MTLLWVLLTIAVHSNTFNVPTWSCSTERPPVASSSLPGGDFIGIPGLSTSAYPPDVYSIVTQRVDSQTLVILTETYAQYVNVSFQGFTVTLNLAQREECYHGGRKLMQVLGTSTPDIEWIQRVGRAPLTKTITFLSAQYGPKERQSFISDVRRACQILQTHAPWSRYYSFMNFAAMYRPDESNLLGCKYGNPHRKLLACSPEKVFGMAATAPPMTEIFVVLVNSAEYGGTGNRGMCVLSTKHAYFDLLLLHELAHSDAGVSDEYTYGFDEPLDIPLENCDSGRGGNTTRWQGWIMKGLLGQPVQGCSYDNYFRPTSDKCLMGSPKTRKYCPVCQESLVKSFYRTRRNLGAPLCPPEGEILHIALNSSVVLYAGRTASEKPDFSILWTTPSESYKALTTITITGQSLGVGIHLLNLTIRDLTPWVLDANRNENMLYHSIFVINVSKHAHNHCVENGPNWKECVLRGGEIRTHYCATCPQGACNGTDIIETKVDSIVDVGTIIEEVGSSMVAMGICTTLGGFLLIFIMWGWSVYRSNNNVQEILPISPGVECIATTTLGLCILLMLFSAVAFVALLYYYQNAQLMAKGMCLLALPIPAILWLISLIGFFATWWKSPAGLGAVATLLLMSAVTCFAVGVVLLWLVDNTETPAIVNRLQAEWNTLTQHRPPLACTVQNTLQCSGFLHPCVEAKNSTSCPRDCAVSNSFPDACYVLLTSYLKQQVTRPAIVIMIFGGVVLLQCVFTFFLCCELVGSRMRIIAKRKTRQANDGQPYEASTQEMNMIRNEFYKATRKDKLLDASEFEAFYMAAFCQRPSAPEIATIMVSCDANGDGLVSWEEFWAMYTRKQGPREEPFVGVLSDAEIEAAVLSGGQDKLRMEVDNMAASVEASLCNGLTRYDLQMLREKWSSIHKSPATPYLTEAELAEVCTLMCGLERPTKDELLRFGRQLNVRGNGIHMIGFREFCYPYAQRAQKHFALDVIRCMGKEGEAQGLHDQFSSLLTRTEAAHLMRVVGVEKDLGDLYLFQQSAPFEVVLARLYLG